MLKIEVKSTEIVSTGGNKNGRDWQIRSQEAYAYIKNRNGTDAAFPEKIRINLDNGNPSRPAQAPYNVGIYFLADSSIYVGDYNALRLGAPILISELEARQIQALKTQQAA